MKRIIITVLTIVLVIMLPACRSTSTVPDTETQGGDNQPNANENEIDGKPAGDSNELRLNRGILENVGKPFLDIFRDEPDLQPQEFNCIDASALCFTDSSKPYSYILFVTQYLPYDEYAMGAIEKKGLRCQGIYTTAGEMFPDLVGGEDPGAFFDKTGVEELSTDELREYGIAYYTSFKYEQMSFAVWGGTVDSPAVMSADDIVTAQIPTENDNLINEYYNDIVYPDGIGCAAAIDRAREYRVSQGGSDCSFYIMREGIIDAWDILGLCNEKVYVVYPNLDWEVNESEKGPVYYVGYTSGEVFERLTLSD